ncbi:MAG: hypothetical protein Q9201_004153 [Fulgogasparrea decipioides]
MRARTPNENVSETAPPIIENVSGAPRFSGADTAESRTRTFDPQLPDHQTVSTDTGSQNSRLGSAPDTNQSQATPQTPHYNLPRSRNCQTNPVQFIPWQPDRSRRLSIRALVAETMRKPVNGKEKKLRLLCVYWNQSNFGYCEIGYTTVDIATRLRKWETKCRRRAKQITQSSQQEGPQERREEEKSPACRPSEGARARYLERTPVL